MDTSSQFSFNSLPIETVSHIVSYLPNNEFDCFFVEKRIFGLARKVFNNNNPFLFNILETFNTSPFTDTSFYEKLREHFTKNVFINYESLSHSKNTIDKKIRKKYAKKVAFLDLALIASAVRNQNENLAELLKCPILNPSCINLAFSKALDKKSYLAANCLLKDIRLDYFAFSHIFFKTLIPFDETINFTKLGWKYSFNLIISTNEQNDLISAFLDKTRGIYERVIVNSINKNNSETLDENADLENLIDAEYINVNLKLNDLEQDIKDKIAKEAMENSSSRLFFGKTYEEIYNYKLENYQHPNTTQTIKNIGITEKTILAYVESLCQPSNINKKVFSNILEELLQYFYETIKLDDSAICSFTPYTIANILKFHTKENKIILNTHSYTCKFLYSFFKNLIRKDYFYCIDYLKLRNFTEKFLESAIVYNDLSFVKQLVLDYSFEYLTLINNAVKFNNLEILYFLLTQPQAKNTLLLNKLLKIAKNLGHKKIETTLSLKITDNLNKVNFSPFSKH